MAVSYNKFNNVFLDIRAEFKKQDDFFALNRKVDANLSTKIECKRFCLAPIYCKLKLVFFGFLYKAGILSRAMYSNVLLGWFFSFKKFWVDYLGNRNIDIIDFHFLRLNYRVKFQEVSLDHTNEKNAEKFLSSWQNQTNIFYLFQSVWNYSKKAFLDVYLFSRFIKPQSHILEYGCGIAPIAQGLINYFPYKKLRFTIADIEQIAFLYARWKLASKPYVNFISIKPSLRDNLSREVKYDVITCLTVFEHLLNPLEVAESFFSHLNKEGILVFDYIKGEATGLNSQQGMKERSEVLKFIEKNFKILKGKIDYENSMGLTVAQKI